MTFWIDLPEQMENYEGISYEEALLHPRSPPPISSSFSGSEEADLSHPALSTTLEAHPPSNTAIIFQHIPIKELIPSCCPNCIQCTVSWQSPSKCSSPAPQHNTFGWNFSTNLHTLIHSMDPHKAHPKRDSELEGMINENRIWNCRSPLPLFVPFFFLVNHGLEVRMQR